MTETSIVAVRAAVYHFNPATEMWESSDDGLSRLDLYHHQLNHRYRVVGVAANSGDVVINSSLTRTVDYQQVTPVFHQWSDTMFSYGVNFASVKEAQDFAQAIDAALLNMRDNSGPPKPLVTSSVTSSIPLDTERKRGTSYSRKGIDSIRAELQQFIVAEINAALDGGGKESSILSPVDPVVPLSKSSRGYSKSSNKGTDGSPVVPPEQSPSKVSRKESKRLSAIMKKEFGEVPDTSAP